MNDTTSRSKWNELAGDGGTRPLSPERLTEIKEGWRQMVRDAGDGLNDRRRASDDVRFCRWRGQCRDSKTRPAALIAAGVFVAHYPFGGQSTREKRAARTVVRGERARFLRVEVVAVAQRWEGGR